VHEKEEEEEAEEAKEKKRGAAVADCCIRDLARLV
jgi:hypothetical protein